MKRWKTVSGVALAIWFALLTQRVVAAEPAVDVAVGAWSEAVTDSRGVAIRGRIVVAERKRADDLREAIVYVELQEASDAVGRNVRIYCDRPRSDPERGRQVGWNWSLVDAQKKTVATSPVPFGGAVPASGWVELASDSSVRLRASPWGLARAGGRLLAPSLDSVWFVATDDATEYSLSAKLVFDPEEGRRMVTDPHIWRGTLELPAVKITGTGVGH